MVKRGSLALAIIALLLVVGCSKPPEVEMQNASTAMQTARSAEAEAYAPESFRMAMDTLNAATAAKEEQDGKFALFRSYGKSKEMFLAAQRLMDKAKADGDAEKERVKNEVMNMMGMVQAVVDSATVALDKAPVGKGNKADIELIRADLNQVATSFAEAKADFDAGKFLQSKAKFDAVANKARSIIAEIEAAKAKKR